MRSNLGSKVVQSVSSPSLSRTHCFNYTLVQHTAPLSLLFLLMKNKHLWAREKTHCTSERQTADVSSGRTLANSPSLHPRIHTHKQNTYTNSHSLSFLSVLSFYKCMHMHTDINSHLLKLKHMFTLKHRHTQSLANESNLFANYNRLISGQSTSWE